MPKYEITDPETGRKLVLTGDTPPTESEINQVFSEYYGESQASQEATPEEGTVLQGIGEAASTLLRAIPSEVASGYTGLTALATGKPLPEAVDLAKEAREAIGYQPETQRGQEYVQNVGDFFGKVGEAVKFMPSMMIGAATAPFQDKGLEGGVELAERIRKEQTGDMLGQETFEATGSPALATLANLTPDLSELFGIGAVGKASGGARNAIESRADKGVAKASQGATKSGAYNPEATESAIESTAKSVQKASPEEIASMIDADPKIMNAIESLGIDAEPVYAQISRNPQYREVEGGLRAMPASDLNKQANEFVSATRNKADELIESYGGVKDKALLSQQFLDDSLKTVDDLSESANKVYSQIDSDLRKSDAGLPQSTMDFLYSKADELGGVDKLDPKFKKLVNDLSEKPTIGMIDQRRKDMGNAAFKNSGIFKDAEEGFAKALYGRLTDDMNDILESKGLKELSDEGKSLVKDRKVLEENLQGLLGKNLTKDLSSVVGAATKGLASGRTKQFVETINKIPEQYRQKAVVTSLNDIFKGKGQGMEAFNANDYLKFWNELQRNPSAKTALFKNLPKGSRGALTGLAQIAKGINQADRTVIRTGIIQSFFEPNTGLVGKMLNSTGRALAATKAGPAGSALYGAVSDLLSQSTSPAQRTASLIATPQFQSVVKKAINERVKSPEKASATLKAAERNLTKTKQYKEWVNKLPDADKISANAGLLTYLAVAGDEEQ